MAEKPFFLYFLTENGVNVYCGITTNPKRRAQEHSRNYPHCKFRIHLADLSEEEARQLEGGYIRGLNLRERGLNVSGSTPPRKWRPRWRAKGHFIKEIPQKKKKTPSISKMPKGPNLEQNTLDFF